MPEGTDLTLALVLTGAGVTVSAALIASVIEILKRLPGLSSVVGANPAAVATVLAAVLVGYAYVVTVPAKDGVNGFAAFLAFVGVAGLAGKTYDVAKSLTAPS